MEPKWTKPRNNPNHQSNKIVDDFYHIKTDKFVFYLFNFSNQNFSKLRKPDLVLHLIMVGQISFSLKKETFFPKMNCLDSKVKPRRFQRQRSVHFFFLNQNCTQQSTQAGEIKKISTRSIFGTQKCSFLEIRKKKTLILKKC